MYVFHLPVTSHCKDREDPDIEISKAHGAAWGFKQFGEFDSLQRGGATAPKRSQRQRSDPSD